ncbi:MULTISPECIES: cupin domain-containing protein [unclassified Agarivorans]|uniref:cupin domain-containing protein n=1 Tax=unclassified Agarivorans TaxID=2636026 RepID=UPI003D7D4632
MKLSQLETLNQYQPPKHFNVSCLKVQGEDTGLTKFWQGLSTFKADGGADWQYGEGTFGAGTEKSYFVIEGQITVENEAGQSYVVNRFESISLQPNEKRKMWNSSNTDAVVLVTVSA